MFLNRTDAGKRLANKLLAYKNKPGVVLAVPRGGVPVAYEVARELNLPMEVILVKKLGHPMNKEYAIGAVGLEDYFVIPHEDVTDYYIDAEVKHVRERLLGMKKIFLGDRKPIDPEGKTLIVIDDGIATGNTLMATLRILKKSHPAKILIAIPVISRQAYEKLSGEADEIIALFIPETFYGVGGFYEDFTQLTDLQVVDYLQKLNERVGEGSRESMP
ncbi:MAG TPA: phosphoribosyltransferase family protein [Flavisolibacter sp.]